MQAVSDELHRMAREWSVRLFVINISRPPYSTLRGNRAKAVRYWAALEYLRRQQSAHRGARVLLADSRDVVFQRDPFLIQDDPSRPLAVFMEDYKRDYANSQINQGHVRPCFGDAEECARECKSSSDEINALS